MAELRFIEDFPVKGVRFIDISPKLADKDDFSKIIDEMSSKVPTNSNYENKNFYFIDDVLATGGTLEASKQLIQKCGGKFVGAGVYINIKALNNLDINYVECE